MSKKLVIVESPSKAKTINKYLGDDFTVIASFGHIRDLPTKDGSVDYENNFQMKYIVPEKCEPHLSTIMAEARNADQIYLATDPDREGEAISWHIIDELESRHAINANTTTHRITFNEITKQSIQYAIQHPRTIDMNLVNSQQTRRALDYLVGFKISPILWRKLPCSKSAGRVQSVALRLICERENEISAFKTEEYWSISAQFHTANKETIIANLSHIHKEKLDKMSITNEQQADDAIKLTQNKTYSVLSVAKKQAKKYPSPPFITSTLQQEAANKLGFRANRTMSAAQKLYEGIALGDKGMTGLITYMRTDGTYIAAEAIQSVRGYISEKMGSKYLHPQARMYKTKIKNAQEAHEAIRPTNISITPESIANYLTDDQYKIYSLIWKRTVASQMSDALIDQTTVNITSEDHAVYFRATGSVVTFAGFMAVYKIDSDKDCIMPPVQENESLQKHSIEKKQHFTQPPARYREASLIKTLEELGIGRPSTYAMIISTLLDRKYADMQNKALVPTPVGRVLTVFLFNYFRQYVEYDFTAKMENDLDHISTGELNWKQFLQQFWDSFSTYITEANDTQKSDIADAISQEVASWVFPKDENNNIITKCPKCQEGTLHLKFSKFGVFVGCDKYPECSYAHNNNQDQQFPIVLGEDQNNQHEISIRKGPYGVYVQSTPPSDSKEKPKRIALPNNIDATTVDIHVAEKLLQLPKEIGNHPQTNHPMTIGIGRFGPYILHDKKYFSIGSKISVLDIGVDTAANIVTTKLNKPSRSTTARRKTTKISVKTTAKTTRKSAAAKPKQKTKTQN